MPAAVENEDSRSPRRSANQRRQSKRQLDLLLLLLLLLLGRSTEDVELRALFLLIHQWVTGPIRRPTKKSVLLSVYGGNLNWGSIQVSLHTTGLRWLNSLKPAYP
ncbi:unnamed protein product [Polarella glacialis]|uniref:Uncharacterized protein n=1 Tax=Polarella glacialis TaxID=89957 RepID=A0A813JJK3_POLGL|nr:unnamed protein product [Polarella glacialis]